MLLNTFVAFLIFFIVLRTAVVKWKWDLDQTGMKPLVESGVFSEEIQSILVRIINKGSNRKCIDLETSEVFLLISHGLDSYYEYKVNVICAMIEHFTSDENSYEKLYLEYFRNFRDEYLNEQECELKEMIDSAVKSAKYGHIDVILGKITAFFNDNPKISAYKSNRTRNFGSLFKQFEEFLDNNFKILYDLNGFEYVRSYLLLPYKRIYLRKENFNPISFLNNNELNVEINLRYEKIPLKIFKIVLNSLQKYKNHKLRFIFDEEILFEKNLDKLKTLKYIENFDKLITSAKITNFTIVYHGCEFEFNSDGFLVDSNAEERLLNGFTCFILASFDYTKQIDCWIDEYKSYISSISEKLLNSLLLTCLKNIYVFMNFIIDYLPESNEAKENIEKFESMKRMIGKATEIRRIISSFPRHSQIIKLRLGDIKCFFSKYIQASSQYETECNHDIFVFSYSCFLHVSSKCLFVAESEDSMALKHLKNNFFAEKRTIFRNIEREETRKIQVSAEIITGQFFDSIYFKNFEQNTSRKVQISFQTKHNKIALFIQYAIVHVTTIKQFSSVMSFAKCIFNPFSRDENLILQVTDNSAHCPQKLDFIYCVFESTVFFEESIYELTLNRCKFMSNVYINNIDVLNIFPSPDFPAIFDLNGFLFRVRPVSKDNIAESVYSHDDHYKIVATNLIFMSFNISENWVSTHTGIIAKELKLKNIIFENSQDGSDEGKPPFILHLSSFLSVDIRKSIGTIYITGCSNLPPFYLTLTEESLFVVDTSFTFIKGATLFYKGQSGFLGAVDSKPIELKEEICRELKFDIFNQE